MCSIDRTPDWGLDKLRRLRADIGDETVPHPHHSESIPEDAPTIIYEAIMKANDFSDGSTRGV